MRHTYIPKAARTYHYWRGFMSASLVLTPVILALVIACNMAISALGY